jgi:hypothetical protein
VQEEKIEFEIYGIDRKHLQKIKQSFCLETDIQAIVFSLQCVAQNTKGIKFKMKRDSIHERKKAERLQKQKAMQKSVLFKKARRQKKAKNNDIWEVSKIE